MKTLILCTTILTFISGIADAKSLKRVERKPSAEAVSSTSSGDDCQELLTIRTLVNCNSCKIITFNDAIIYLPEHGNYHSICRNPSLFDSINAHFQDVNTSAKSTSTPSWVGVLVTLSEKYEDTHSFTRYTCDDDGDSNVQLSESSTKPSCTPHTYELSGFRKALEINKIGFARP